MLKLDVPLRKRLHRMCIYVESLLKQPYQEEIVDEPLVGVLRRLRVYSDTNADYPDVL